MVKVFNKSGKLSALPKLISKGEIIRDWKQPKYLIIYQMHLSK